MKRMLLAVVFLFLIAVEADAQCSMCSAVVETSQRSGSEFAEGLNAGILYLMGVPYALLVLMGVLLFRRLNQNNSESEHQ
jgi:hypothetical protein